MIKFSNLNFPCTRKLKKCYYNLIPSIVGLDNSPTMLEELSEFEEELELFTDTSLINERLVAKRV